MNQSRILTRFALFLLLGTSQVHGQERLRIIDRGTDGDVRYYTVVCPSGKRTAVSDFYEKAEICTMLVNSKEKICRKGWDVDSAAKEACQ